MSKIIYIDTETTGLYAGKHALREVGFIIEIDGEVVHIELLKIDPFSYSRNIEIDKKALEISGINITDLIKPEHGDSSLQFNYFLKVLEKYVNKSDKKDNFQINGYNTNFDIGFIKDWFADNDNHSYSSYFSYKELDVFALVKQLKYLGLINTPNDKLKTLCDYFNIPLKAHNAQDDIIATRQLQQILVDKFIVHKK